MEVLTGPAVVVTGPELEALGRQLTEAIHRGWGIRHAAPPRVLLDFAIAVSKLTPGTPGTGRPGSAAGQGAAAEPRNTSRPPGAGMSGQPVKTLSVKEAAQAAEVSESYVRRLVRDGNLEVRDSQGPGYAIYADSLAAWQEHRRRKENNPKAA